MTAPITSYPIGTTPTTPAPTASGHSSTLDKDAFLKLLVAQLRYQDPSSPADASTFMAQTAQFTQVERLEELTSQQHVMLAAQQLMAAGSLVGRSVSYTGSDALPHTGVVTSVSLGTGEPTLHVGDADVPLSAVKEIRATAG